MAYPYDPRQQNPGYNPPAWANPQQQQWTNPQPNPTPPPQPQFYNAPLVPQPRTVPCRVVNNPADITPSEIPMDGRVSLFLSSDNSYIIAKQWNQNGLIDTAIYRPEIQNQYLINTLRPCPVPSYQVQNPWAASQYGGCCGSNSNCCNYG